MENEVDTRLSWTPALMRWARMTKQWSLAETVTEFKRLYPEPTVKISKNQILEYETGGSIPRADRIAILSDLYGVDPSVFFTRTKEEVKEKMGQMYQEVMDSLKRRGPTYLERKN